MSRYILLRPSGYYFRFVLPQHFRCLVGKRELRYALDTRLRSVAIRRARACAVVVDTILTTLAQQQTMTEDEITQIIANYIHQVIQDLSDDHFARPRPLSDVEHENRLETVSALISETREAIAKGDWQQGKRVAELAFDHANKSLDAGSEDYPKACSVGLKVGVTALEYEESLLLGRPTLPAMLFPLQTASAGRDAQTPASTSQATTGPRVSELYPIFISDKVGAGDINRNTATAYERALHEFAEVMSDPRVAAVTRRDVVTYRDTLQRLPAQRNKLRQYRNLTMSTLLEMEIPPEERLSARTISENLLVVSAFFKWAILEQHCNTNPTEGVTIKTDSKSYEPFTEDELRRMFTHSRYVDNKFNATYQFWLPLLGLFTGARISELCQIRLDDIKSIDGVDAISIESNPETGQRTKTKAGIRTIPIHSKLIELGFLDYVNYLRAEGHQVLFPDLRQGERKAGENASKWFPRFKRECGVTNKRKTFHSFRHMVNTLLYQNRQHPAHIQQIMGHRKSSLGESDTYLHNFPPKELKDIVDSIRYDVNLCHLKDRWVAYKKAY